jgi:hypothetical protein
MISGHAHISERDLAWVDAHFGPGTSLDELIATMHLLLSEEDGAPSQRHATRQWSDST